ncbi:hypothetical protein GLOIN_2v130609 [Rhizophagus irregularis DAOM 181602=DAOM 197198]|uniref:Uncharacterized protein n=1 Tax=Rhizophagus irregularis (strain DAOM 181602 / DAOM 197198 / MUCL 43194) TaxID=747089 RepID=A0A2P4PY37_RHIID|nr:hypothetical protein GLOIN_2v130609 [Rhizophagus irregularis DAOM 181602=DAOM 197198]POG70280.1 hypothetical protein GLOIN_2v130609 [Rhizophagus irregularis DAOM 181602=DAOM 197198]GET54662.1 hypothetical protein GLOIN_2v130609 [Rhizophagus irregularis DAOM 181602=DAOM 197198]|eukprot:XP_025177146.1 hypothetical protein GLOIN_2v130609 [Rhizophagus irregularis DAOM 181602=DAOM 197198]
MFHDVSLTLIFPNLLKFKTQKTGFLFHVHQITSYKGFVFLFQIPLVKIFFPFKSFFFNILSLLFVPLQSYCLIIIISSFSKLGKEKIRTLKKDLFILGVCLNMLDRLHKLLCLLFSYHLSITILNRKFEMTQN